MLARVPAVEVFDGVFSSATCAALHEHASSRGLGHALYSRSSGPSTPLEHAFESFLSELGDPSANVEYWSRQEWKHIEAHADVDEALAAKGGPMRYPSFGHVMYLSVGPRVNGPTCVWQPGEKGGRFGGALSVVPAVEGRVLRFQGQLQHAVPRPADVWLAPFAISQSGTKEDFMRSVVLFNCWPDEDAPPLDVERDPPALVERLPQDNSLFHAAPRERWDAIRMRAAQHSGGQSATTMKLWLLGDEARRGQAERTRPMRVDAEATLDAFMEPIECTTLEPIEQ